MSSAFDGVDRSDDGERSTDLETPALAVASVFSTPNPPVDGGTIDRWLAGLVIYAAAMRMVGGGHPTETGRTNSAIVGP